jgi:hypothetical protein
MNFNSEERVNLLMGNRPFFLHQKELEISRYLPKQCSLSGQITSALSITICKTKTANGSTKEFIEYELTKYLEKFGKIVDWKWQNDNEVILQFKE